ncbi:MAG: RNA polymerase sigma-70 factor [Gloeobacteraceae cyanobacterium ES-bin-316]|nr:RNA polymerase sigma-70 factor [Ferruginibacter sp.]
MPTREHHIKVLQNCVGEHSDQAAFKELYCLLYKDLFRFATVFVYEKELAEEVLQDVFTKMWLQRDQLSRIHNLKVYLYSSVKNAAINYRKKYPLQSLTDPDLSAIELSYSACTPEDLMISNQMLAAINHAIHSMPPKCKLVFLLVKEDELKYREVADILNISIKTVETQMGIALKKLATAIPFHIPKK